MTDKWVAARQRIHIAIGTKLVARWVAFLGFGLAPFPVWQLAHALEHPWVLVVNLYILIDNLRRAPGEDEANPA
jgi:hypothetical protein